MAAVDHINATLQEGDPKNTLLALKKPEAQLPPVYPFAAVMYQNELFNLQKQNTSVRHSCVYALTKYQQEGRLLREAGSQGQGYSVSSWYTDPASVAPGANPRVQFSLTLLFGPRGKC